MKSYLLLCVVSFLGPSSCEAFALEASSINRLAPVHSSANKQAIATRATTGSDSGKKDKAPSSPEKEVSSPTPVVQVFDNVFSSEACRLLHQLAIDHSERASNCDGSSIFYRSSDAVYMTPLESAIDSVLNAMGDTSEVVEYWSREEYINIDAHADIDEGGLLDDYSGVRLRCPNFGHILYMSVGEGVHGPTFIFPDKLVGWGGSRCDDHDDGNDDLTTRNVEMITVPAVVGRVVRFDGRAMHAVPKPVDRWWLLSDVEEAMLREKENDGWRRGQSESSEDDDFEFWEDEDEEEDADELNNEPMIEPRSVLLFNTWNYCPSFVDQDPALHMPSGIGEIISNDDEESSSGPASSDMIMSCWEEEYGPNGIKVRCNEHQWINVPIIKNAEQVESSSHDDDSTSKSSQQLLRIRVNLMGNKKRRCYPKTNAILFATSSSSADAAAVRFAAFESKDPTSFVLREEETTQCR